MKDQDFSCDQIDLPVIMSQRKMLVGLHGLAGSGKTTVEEHLKRRYGFISNSFAAPLKAICGTLFKLTPEQMEDQELKKTHIPRLNATPRYILQRIGTDLFRNHLADAAPDLPYKSLWLDLGEEWINDHVGQNRVMTDCRFENELDMLDRNDGLLIGLDRGAGVAPSHASEQTFFDRCDAVIQNNGTVDELLAEVDRIIVRWNNILMGN